MRAAMGVVIEIHHPVATRELWVRRARGPSRRVLVKIGKPRRVGRDRYECALSIEGLPSGRIGKSCLGVDGFQAIQIAQAIIHVDLISCSEYKRGTLYWLSPESGDLGFPNLLEGAMRAKRKRSTRPAAPSVPTKEASARAIRESERTGRQREA